MTRKIALEADADDTKSSSRLDPLRDYNPRGGRSKAGESEIEEDGSAAIRVQSDRIVKRENVSVSDAKDRQRHLSEGIGTHASIDACVQVQTRVKLSFGQHADFYR